MKKLLVIALILSLLLCAMSALAELGSADVAMNGNQYHISLESVEIKDGKLYVATSGMAQTMAFGPQGIQLAADIVPVYGEERLYATDKDILFGADVTYRFDRDTLPDCILMIPTQDPENPITLWENPDAEPAIPDSPDEGTAIPDELVGQWQGTGAPKNGGPSIDLTAAINADGTGEYTFDQSGYHESYPFTLSSDDSAFSVDIPADNTLGIARCEGTWVLEDGVLKLDITTTFANGGSYSYTAECEKVSADAAPDEPAEVPTSIATGDIVTFGRYEQDGDDANGPEPIEWLALEANGTAATLISRYGLDARPCNESGYRYGSADWRYCSLREWLNGDFLSAAFAADEQAQIETSVVTENGVSSVPTDDEAATCDQVYLLSAEEAGRFFSSDLERTCEPTRFAINRGVRVSESGTCQWWLRHFRNTGRADGVGSNGKVIDNTMVEGYVEYVAVRPVIRLDLARAFTHAEPGTPVCLGGADYELQLFTMAQDNWDLVSASARDPLPAQGEVYLLRFAVAEGGDAVTPDTIKESIAPAMGLYAEDEGVASELFRIVTPDDNPTQVFDILFYCESFHALEDLALLCDGVLYPLDGLPRDGEKLPLPTPEELAIEALNALHARAKNEAGDAIENAACTGNVIVAWYTNSEDGASPQVITTGSINEWDFPLEYRAESFDTARWAAIIHPTYKQIGWYGGIAPGAANETTTWLSLVDLETNKLYEVKVATEDPPQTITVQTINGIPQHSGASGDFKGDDALARLTQLIETARTAPTPSPTPEPTPEPTEEPTATPVPESILGLNALYDRARRFLGSTDPQEVYGKDTVVAIYYYDYIGTYQEPEVLTADAEKVYGFPREYLAESWESAKRAAIIYPDIEGAGWYSNGYPASSTATCIVLFDLEGDRQSERIQVAFNDPPQYYTNDGKGKFEYQKALTRLASDIEAALANPSPEPTEDLPDVKSLLDAGAQDAANKLRMGSTGLNERIGVGVNAAESVTPAEDGISDADMTDVILDALSEEVYRTTYDALRSGEVIQKGSKGDAAKGVQQTLVAFGQSISVDGNVGPKSIAALNAVQAAFGLPETESLDAEGYAALLPRLLMVTNPDKADALLAGQMDSGEYDYTRACALAAQGKYASAKALFEASGWGDWEARAEACVQPWPKTGVLYKNPEVKGSSAELTVKFNTNLDTAMLVKVYTADGVLARTMFIGGTGKATCSLPAGTYIIKDGTGHDWYGEEEAFGSEGAYEIMTFGDGQQEVQLKKNYSSTITVNVQEDNPDAEGVGSDWESWSDF